MTAKAEIPPYRQRTGKEASHLRRRLIIAATAGLLVTLAMTLIVVDTARTAQIVVQQAEISQTRIQAFSQLQFAADRFQRATYAAVRENDPQTVAALAASRQQFRSALHATENLPVHSTEDSHTLQRLQVTGRAVEQLFANGGAIVHKVDAQWKSQGSIAALKEIQQLSAPYFTLVGIATSEIRAGNDHVRAAAQRAHNIQRFALPAASVGVLLSLLASGLLLGVILFRLSPGLRALEEGAHAFGGGEVRSRIRIKGRDELAQVASAFNGMADQIEAQRRALEGTANALEGAVAERTRELKAAHASLASVDQRRRIFFAEIGHELRTPITIIQGEAQLALRHADQKGSANLDSFERILEQAHDLGRLVRDLFLIARAEADGLELMIEPVAIGPLFQRLAGEFEAIMRDRDGVIRVDVEAGLTVAADSMRLRQIFGALINNASAHTPGPVCIRLRGFQREDQVVLRVEDNGPGLDPGMRDELLLRFRRGKTRADGAGLGLAIVRALTEAHRGRIHIENLPQGGLAVEITLPVQSEQTGKEEKDDAGPVAGGGCGARESISATRTPGGRP